MKSILKVNILMMLLATAFISSPAFASHGDDDGSSSSSSSGGSGNGGGGSNNSNKVKFRLKTPVTLIAAVQDLASATGKVKIVHEAKTKNEIRRVEQTHELNVKLPNAPSIGLTPETAEGLILKAEFAGDLNADGTAEVISTCDLELRDSAAQNIHEFRVKGKFSIKKNGVTKSKYQRGSCTTMDGLEKTTAIVVFTEDIETAARTDLFGYSE
jgi:hypothetical protein